MKKTETKSLVLLRHHLKALKLPTLHDECEKIAGRCAADTHSVTGHRRPFGLPVAAVRAGTD